MITLKSLSALVLLVLTASAQSVTYHGGPVLVRGAQVYFVWFGPWTDANKLQFKNFTIGAQSGYINALAPYYDSTGAHIAVASGIAGEMNVPGSGTITSTQMIRVMEKAINQSGQPCDAMGVYVFMPGPGTAVTGLGGASSHGSFPCGPEDGVWTPTSIQVPAVYVPGNIINFSHELVEAMTDPLGNWAGHEAWFQDVSGLEVADPGICGTASYYALPTGTFLASNYAKLTGGCTAGGGSSPAPLPPPPVPPPPPCPPGTHPRGNSGKCK